MNATVIAVDERTQKRDIVPRVEVLGPGATPMQMLAIAVQQGADIDKMKQLMELSERWEANEARKAFVKAMAAFKAEPLIILKTKRVDIQGGAKFSHATLANVVDGVCSTLSKFGLSHNWITEQVDKSIKVTCVITHELGHSERTELSGPADDSGKKNAIQQIGSTVTYLQRYTLLSACGLAAKDMDDDGRSAKLRDKEPDGYDNWAADMEALADEGTARLQGAWQKASDEFRRYVVKFDDDWWTTLKAKAGKVAA